MINSHTIEVIIYVIYSVVVITLGILVNKKLHQNVKNEEHLEKGKIIQKIMKNHSLAQCVVWPIIILTGFILKMNKDVLDIIPHKIVGYIIIAIRLVNSLYSCYTGFNSLIIAISRYTCIVYENTVEQFGVKKLRQFLISSTIGIPVFFAVLNESLIPVEHVWGAYFMPNYTNSLDETGTNERNANDFLQQSPLFLISNVYLPSSIMPPLKFVRLTILFLVHSNLLEGMLYLHLYILYNRSQNNAFLKMALSDDYRKRRHRRYTISLQMTVTSWSLELVTGIIALGNTLFFSHHEIFNTTTQILVFTHVFLYFVVIPGSYLLNTEVSKNLIVEQGWGKILPFHSSRNRVAPALDEDIEMNSIHENNPVEQHGPDHVPIISGNVNLETSYAVY